MNDSNLLSLFFVDSNGNNNYGLAIAFGKYQASSEFPDENACLIIFMCPNCDSIFSFYCVDFSGNYIRHTALHSGEDSIDYVLLEAWRRFNVLPYYWILAEETEYPGEVMQATESEYLRTYERLREVVSRFRWAEITRTMADDNTRVSGDKETEQTEQDQLDRLFYPDIPQEISAPLTL